MNRRLRAGLLAALMIGFIPVTSASAITTTQITQQEIDKAVAEQQATIRQHINTSKQELCRQVIGSVNGIKRFLGEMSERHIEYIRGWDMAARDYKDSKKLNVPRYEDLVAKAEFKYDAAYTALAIYKQVPDLSCTSDGPLADFQLIMVRYMQLVMAIFEYLLAVFDLYMGILMAQIQAYMTQMQQDMQANMSNIQTCTQGGTR